MPEGPSIVILKEAVRPFTGKKVIAARGNTRAIDINELEDKTVLEFKSWGKHFLICFPGFSIRVHLMLYGSYLINDRKEAPERLSLHFDDGEINFYSCSIKRIDEPLDMIYDWSTDVLSSKWNANKAIQKLAKSPETMVCDALLNQDIFAGVGNIIKNEVLFRVYIHPESLTGCLPPSKLKELVREAKRYSWQFYEWKKQFLLRKNWLAYRQQVCPRNNVPLVRHKTGTYPRLSFYCPVCQRLYK
jgi:endonuclease-8